VSQKDVTKYCVFQNTKLHMVATGIGNLNSPQTRTQDHQITYTVNINLKMLVIEALH